MQQDRSNEVDTFIDLIGFVLDRKDRVFNNQEIFTLQLSWGYFTDWLYNTNDNTFPWISFTTKQALYNILSYQPVVQNLEALIKLNPNRNNGEIGIYYNKIPDSIIVSKDKWYQFHFEFLKQHLELWKWDNEYFPNSKYWKASTNDDSLTYSEFFLIEYFDKEFPARKNETNSEKLNYLCIKYTRDLADMEKFNPMVRTIFTKLASEVITRNFYTYEQELSSKEQKQIGSLREIYSIQKNRRKQYLSIDFKNGLLEVCNESGKHLGAINYLGILKEEPDKTGKHDIMSLK